MYLNRFVITFVKFRLKRFVVMVHENILSPTIKWTRLIRYKQRLTAGLRIT